MFVLRLPHLTPAINLQLKNVGRVAPIVNRLAPILSDQG